MFALMRELRDQGMSILFISHRFHEVDALADVVSVFRSGRHIETFPNKTHSYAEIIGLMIGQRMEELFPPRLEGAPGSLVLEVQNSRWRGNSKTSRLRPIMGRSSASAGSTDRGRPSSCRRFLAA